jgi:hypothetical protein
MENLPKIAESIRAELDAKNAVRDKALVTSREAIRFCANSIRAIHRGQFEEAADLLKRPEPGFGRPPTSSRIVSISTTPATSRTPRRSTSKRR